MVFQAPSRPCETTHSLSIPTAKSAAAGTPQARAKKFSGCIVFLDGTEIPLQSKPKYDHGDLLLLAQENRVYGFNLQAGVAGLSRRLPSILPALMIQQPSRTVFCTENDQLMSNDEHLLADKAYQLDHHVITPDKEPVARQRSHASFNYVHSTTRAKFEHAFSVLKARWKSLHKPGPPIRILKMYSGTTSAFLSG